MAAINVIGASGHAKVVIEIAEQQAVAVQHVYDSNPDIGTLAGYKVLPQSAIAGNNDAPFIIAIGNNAVRKKLDDSLPVTFTTLIHPHTSISRRATAGAGTVIMAGVSVNSGTSIGRHCIINTNASVDHDCIIEDYVHISPNTGLAGNVFVGEGTHVGIGAQVIQGIRIGRWATVGAGTVVIRDIPDYAVVVGNPGRIIKYNNPPN